MNRGRFLQRLLHSERATAALEFALAMPLLLAIGLGGAEAANRAIVQMRINQLAMLVADNASRVGETSLLGEVELYESDINDIFMGADLQGGSYIDLLARGRIILSSLEVVDGTEDQQFIHWQRCKGVLRHPSSHGEAGDGLGTPIEGMGPEGAKVQSFPGEAVMFVEIAYDYRPLVADVLDHGGPIVAIAAFNVRNNRDLSGVAQRNEADPDPVSLCSIHDDFED